MTPDKRVLETVGFIGLGNMGAGIAGNIVGAGHPMVVYDTKAEAANGLLARGARVARSAAEVARLSDVVFTSLPGPTEVEAIALGRDGILEGIARDGVYVDLSTVRPGLMRDIDDAFRQKATHVLDAPVSGGKIGAENGTLAVMVGGARNIFERVKPILEIFGDNIFYAGTIGAGSVCKLVHNLISNSVRQAIAEGLTLGVKAGVEPLALWECVRRGAVGRSHDLHETLPRTMFRGAYEPASFMLSLARKDVGLATDLAREHDVPLPIGSLIEQLIIEATNRGWGQMDSTVMVRLQEERAGAEVRAPHIDLDRAAAFISTHPEK